MAKLFPIKPAHPERICWGCDKYCPVDQMQCGNGTVATPHPCELFGDDWMEWGLEGDAADARRGEARKVPDRHDPRGASSSRSMELSGQVS